MNTRALAVTLALLAGAAAAGMVARPVHAEQVVLDVEAAVSMARENNVALKQARIELGIQDRARKTSWNRYLPSLSAGTSLSHAQTATPSGFQDPTPWDLSASLSSSLPLSAASAYEIRAAELEYGAGEIALEKTDKQLERDIRKAFFSLLLKLENIRLLEQSLETARKRYDQVNANYEYGLVSELDKLNALVNLENLRPELEKARTDYQTAGMELKQGLGLPRKAELALEGSIEAQVLELDAEELIRERGSSRLEAQAQLRQLAILENQRQLAGAQEYSPVLSLSYSYRVRQSDPFSASGWAGAGWSGISSLSFSLSVPLDGTLPSSESRVRLAGIDDSIRKTELQLALVREEGAIRIETLVLNLQRSGLSIEVLKKNAELAQRVYELTEQEYEAGLTDLLTLEESYDDLQQARLKVLTEQYNYVSLRLDLEYELNSPLGD